VETSRIHLAELDLLLPLLLLLYLLPLSLPFTAHLTHLSMQANELEYATKYYAAILARSTGKDLATCQKEYLSR
jgi:hypothetical protein